MPALGNPGAVEGRLDSAAAAARDNEKEEAEEEEEDEEEEEARRESEATGCGMTAARLSKPLTASTYAGPLHL
jgi:hypothetical protein